MNEQNNSSRNQSQVLGVSGSMRKESFNTGLLRDGQEIAPDDVAITIFDLKDISFYNGDMEVPGDPESVATLNQTVREADALLLATADHNDGLPAPVKNAFDRASRSPSGLEESAIYGKTVDLFSKLIKEISRVHDLLSGPPMSEHDRLEREIAESAAWLRGITGRSTNT